MCRCPCQSPDSRIRPLTDQHEQHLRAVLGLPLGGTALKVPAVGMLNVIGSADGELATTLRPVARALAMPRASVHLRLK